MVEEMTELVVEKSKSSEKEPASSSVTVIPESPVNQEKATKQSVVESNSENSPETAGKRKTPPSKVHTSHMYRHEMLIPRVGGWG